MGIQLVLTLVTVAISPHGPSAINGMPFGELVRALSSKEVPLACALRDYPVPIFARLDNKDPVSSLRRLVLLAGGGWKPQSDGTVLVSLKGAEAERDEQAINLRYFIGEPQFIPEPLPDEDLIKTAIRFFTTPSEENLRLLGQVASRSPLGYAELWLHDRSRTSAKDLIEIGDSLSPDRQVLSQEDKNRLLEMARRQAALTKSTLQSSLPDLWGETGARAVPFLLRPADAWLESQQTPVRHFLVRSPAGWRGRVVGHEDQGNLTSVFIRPEFRLPAWPPSLDSPLLELVKQRHEVRDVRNGPSYLRPICQLLGSVFDRGNELVLVDLRSAKFWHSSSGQDPNTVISRLRSSLSEAGIKLERKDNAWIGTSNLPLDGRLRLLSSEQEAAVNRVTREDFTTWGATLWYALAQAQNPLQAETILDRIHALLPDCPRIQLATPDDGLGATLLARLRLAFDLRPGQWVRLNPASAETRLIVEHLATQPLAWSLLPAVIPEPLASGLPSGDGVWIAIRETESGAQLEIIVNRRSWLTVTLRRLSEG